MVQVDLKLSLAVVTELINNSDNPAVALALIEGTYKEPYIQDVAYNATKKMLLTFISFDKWKNKVYYSYPKFRWYKADRSDWSYNQSKEYTEKEPAGIGNDNVPLDEWLVFATDYQVEYINQQPSFTEFIDLRKSPTDPTQLVTE